MDAVLGAPGSMDPPPLLFGPRPPSPHPAHSNITSPSSSHLPQANESSSHPAREMDLSSSLHTLPPPVPTQHTIDARPTTEGPLDGMSRANGSDFGIGGATPAEPAEDVMDTTPDGTPLAPNPSLDSSQHDHDQSGHAQPAADSPDEHPHSLTSMPALPTPTTSANGLSQPSANSTDENIDQDTQTRGSQELPTTFILPYPRPENTRNQAALLSSPNRREELADAVVVEDPVRGHVEDDTDHTSDSDDDLSDSEIYVEDGSIPDEDEMKEIESVSEMVATDHEYNEGDFFEPLDDPEYIPEETGRIQWIIPRVRGTKGNPNRAVVMRSNAVRIGHYDWRIKFFPKGNDTDQFSVYVECSKPDTVEDAGSDHNQAVEAEASDLLLPEESNAQSTAGTSSGGSSSRDDSLSTANNGESGQSNAETLSSASSPSNGSDGPDKDKDWGTAAQFGVVMYNPNEPRVSVRRSNVHRFSGESPDWGWTRFHGPYRRVNVRENGQRQALLRNDTLALTAYIRIIKDETGDLWANENDECPAKTRPRALGCEYPVPGPGFLVATLSTFSFLPPFRKMINAVPTSDPSKPSLTRPKELVIAFQRLLHQLESPSITPVSIQPIVDYIQERGFFFVGHNADVVECWELLRSCLEEELHGSALQDSVADLFDGSVQQSPKDKEGDVIEAERIHISAGKWPSFRLPVKSVGDVQTALGRVLDGDDMHGKASVNRLPQILQVELDRQEFDTPSRRWKKLVDKVEINEQLDLCPWSDEDQVSARYTLFGFVVHKGDLHSGLFYPVVRPGGPGTRWLANVHDKGRYRMLRLTRKQALVDHEGVAPGQDSDGTEPVPYILLYVRNDVIDRVLLDSHECSDPPDWIVRERETPGTSDEEALEVQVFRSELCKDYSGKGILDMYNLPSTVLASNMVINVSLNSSATISDLQHQLMSRIDGLEDPRQCALWIADLAPEYRFSPKSLAEASSLKGIKILWKKLQLWLHIIPIADIPPTLPPPPSAAVPPSQAIESVPPEVQGASTTPATEMISLPLDSSRVPEALLTAAAERTDDLVIVDFPPHAADGSLTNASEQANREVRVSSPPIGPSTLEAVEGTSSDVTLLEMVGRSMRTHEVRRRQRPPTRQTALPSEDTPMVEEHSEAAEDASDVRSEAVSTIAELGQHGEVIRIQSVPESTPSAALASEPQDQPLEQGNSGEDVDMVEVGRVETGETARQGTQAPPTRRQSNPTLGSRDERRLTSAPRLTEAGTFVPASCEYTYFLIKRFLVSTQELKCLGMFRAKIGEKIEDAVPRVLEVPAENQFAIWREGPLHITGPIPVGEKFQQGELDIIVLQDRLSQEEISEIERRGDIAMFPEFVNYLGFRACDSKHLDCIDSRNYFSGASYTVQRTKGRYHGHGKFIYENGDQYEGNLVGDFRNGKGVMRYQNGDVYDGEWKLNVPDGRGKFVYAKTGNTYVGGFKAGRRHGRGVMQFLVADEEQQLCQICYEEEMDSLFYDCGHVCACVACAKQLSNCPVCRKPIISAVKMFRAC